MKREELLEQLRKEVKNLDKKYTFEGIKEIAEKHNIQAKELYTHIAYQNYVITSR